MAIELRTQKIGLLVEECEVDTETGEKHGRFSLLKAGQFLALGYYSRGLTNGLWKYWHENGQKREEGLFDMGKPIGCWRWWDDSGQLRAEGNFVDGREHGLWFEYCGEKRVLIGEWKDGKPVAGEFVINEKYYKYNGGLLVCGPLDVVPPGAGVMEPST